MPTPKFDKLCVDFVKRIPDQLVAQFTPGTAELPRSFLLDAPTIIDYVNRGILTLFNTYFKSVNGDLVALLKIFPELQRTTDLLEAPQSRYVIASPHRDFFGLIGGYIDEPPDIIQAKIVSADKFADYVAGKLTQYKATPTDPVMIYVNNAVHIFPRRTNKYDIYLHYIAYPVVPTTGDFIQQNGNFDNPFLPHWDKEIIDIAYSIYLAETVQTT